MSGRKNNFVIYTVNVGGYDEVKQPKVVDDRFDYILFTDQKKSDKIGVWEVRTFDYYNEDKKRMSNYVKLQACRCLPEYMASLCIDANVQIVDKWIYSRFIECYYDNVDWSSVALVGDREYEDGNLYGHIQYCVLEGWENRWRALNWSHMIRKANFPERFSCFEDNIIFRQNSEIVRNIENKWWEYYEAYVRRDQFILPFVMWNNPDLNKQYYLPVGQHVWSSPYVKSYSHNQNERTRKSHAPYRTYRGIAQLDLMRRNETIKNKLNRIYYSLCKCPSIIAYPILEMISLLILAIYGPVIICRKIGSRS